MPPTGIAPPPGEVPPMVTGIGGAVRETMQGIGDTISGLFGGDGGGPFGLPADSRTPEEVWEEFNRIQDENEGEDRRKLLEQMYGGQAPNDGTTDGSGDGDDGADDGSGDSGDDGGDSGTGGTTPPADPLSLYEQIYGVQPGTSDPFFYYPELNAAVRANYEGNVPDMYDPNAVTPPPAAGIYSTPSGVATQQAEEYTAAAEQLAADQGELTPAQDFLLNNPLGQWMTTVGGFFAKLVSGDLQTTNDVWLEFDRIAEERGGEDTTWSSIRQMFADYVGDRDADNNP